MGGTKSKTKSNSLITSSAIITGSLVAAVLITGSVLSSVHVNAETEATDEVNITVPVSCSMNGTVGTVHTATIANGLYSGATDSDYENGIGTTTLSVFCNDNNGFSIYAIGYTGDTLGNNNLVGTNTNLTIPTGVYQSGDTTSKWSMKVSAGTDSGDTTNHPLTIDNNFGNFHAVPGENDGYMRVAHKDSFTAMSGTPSGATLTTTYDVYISATQAADTYTGQVKYVMVHPYMQDDGNAPIAINPPASCVTPVPNITYMQQVTPANRDTILSTMTLDTQYYLVDSRDNKTYCVARLADGNIWMTQNLDHDIDSTKTYTSADTDIPTDWTPVASTHATSDTEWDYDMDDTDSWGFYHAQSYDPGKLYWNGTLSPNSSNNQTSSTGDSHYHLGNYYNWPAAVAMDDISGLAYDTLVDQSICPAGWTLPRVGDGEDTFAVLWEEYNFYSRSFTDTNNNSQWDTGESALWTSPLYFTPSGNWYGELHGVGRFGAFLPPINYDGISIYDASFNVSGYSDPMEYENTIYGDSIRCVARPVTANISGLWSHS